MYAKQNQNLSIEKFIGRREHDGGSIHWSSAIRLESRPGVPLLYDSLNRSMSVRYRVLDELGIAFHPHINMPLKEFVKDPERAFKIFDSLGEKEFFPFIQPRTHRKDLPDIGLMKLDKGEIVQLANAIDERYPHTEYDISITPFRKILYNGTLTVNERGKLYGEFVSPGELPSRGKAEILFSVQSQQFLPSLQYTTNDTHQRSAAWAAIKSLPIEHDSEEQSYLPGYYEFAVGIHPSSGAFEVIFTDYHREPSLMVSL